MSTNPKDQQSEAERRSVQRWLRNESVSVQVMQPCVDGSCPARVIATRTIDLSCQGMRLLVEDELEEGRLFDICVELRDHPRRFLLTGETRWCRPHSPGPDYEVGLEIQEGEGTDYLVWAEVIAGVVGEG